VLRIKDRAFEVDQSRSELLAYVPQGPPGVESPGYLRWSIEVHCLDQETEQDIAAPGLYANDLNLDLSDWRSLEGTVIQDGDAHGLAAHLGDGLINERTANNLLRFTSRNGPVFTLEWQCLARLFTLEGDSQPLPLQLNTEIAFNGVHIWWVEADTQGLATARALVGRHFDLTALQEPEIAGPFHIVFPPIEPNNIHASSAPAASDQEPHRGILERVFKRIRA
jgi:hypothetical protein